jgi:hypothetical protein
MAKPGRHDESSSRSPSACRCDYGRYRIGRRCHDDEIGRGFEVCDARDCALSGDNGGSWIDEFDAAWKSRRTQVAQHR